MMGRIGIISASILAIATASPAIGQVDETAPELVNETDRENANEQSPYESPTIIVTASRRAERFQDVPSALTALEGETLERIGAQSFRDYSTLVPGLSQRDSGNPGQGTIIIRGLNTGPQSITNTSAVYIGDAPFSASGFLSAGALLTPDPDIADLNRIEVLKGPQGTLYGANSLGGLIRIVPIEADPDAFSARLWGEVTTVDHGGWGYAARGSVNVPVVEGLLGIRANAVYRLAPGFTDNALLVTENVNESVIQGGRLALRFTPADNLTIDLAGFYQKIENRGVARQDNITGTLIPRDGEYQYRALFDAVSDLEYRIGTGSVTYDFGAVSAIGTLSYGEYRTDLFSDGTEIYLPTLRVIGLGAILPADGQILSDFSPNLDKLTAELRLVSDRLGPVEFILGGFYTDESSVYRANIFARDAAGTPLPSPFDVLVRTTTLSDYQEIAAFGNLTVYFSDEFDVTGGIRFAHNEQEAQTGGPGAVVFYAPRATANFSFEDDVATYLATARWRPHRNFTAYLRAASGYRPGGPQNNPMPPPGAQTEIRPDTTWNYEAGIRGIFMDGALSINASIYHIDWSDIQLNTQVVGVVLQANGGSADVDGFELEAVARPTRLLTLAANLGYTNARLTRVDPGVSTSIGAQEGDKLPLTPEWSMALLADQRIPLGVDTDLQLGGTLRFRSDMPSSYPGTILNPNIKIPSVTTLDLRAGIEFGRYRVQLRAENVFDEFGYTTVATNYLVTPAIPTPTSGFVIRPRSFTLAFGVEF